MCTLSAQALRGKAESIRAGELDKALAKVGEGLTKKQLKAIEELSRSIVNKILHGPMTALRCDGSDPGAVGQVCALPISAQNALAACHEHIKALIIIFCWCEESC